ncbi:MAG: sigma-54-dependent Fis family transcriptional regulator [Pedosphaera sp.]|nr:sigma-54-dependent Fis family transcriptional regulator [Pedosphaera sp.]MSU43064.1 sigma-54-dependent Fis family transcriptional regulator [Pedosphaera sp.]
MDKLLLIDDEADVRYSFERIFGGDSSLSLRCAGSGEEALQIIPQWRPDLVLMDIRMAGLNGIETLKRLRESDPKTPVILMTAFGTTQMAIQAMKHGAYDYVLKPFEVPRLKQLVADALHAARTMRQVVSYQPLLDREDYDLGIVGRSLAMQEVFKLIGQLAASDVTALITGESGTGKELVARAIYHHSDRSKRPFLAINCAAIPEALLESELFGHEKGAFTGAATQRIGKFEQSHGGTLFLDEIGDMSPATQTKILRVLQDGVFERVGGGQPVRVDVRIIAATNKPLEQAVAARQFREDLFYRLNVVRVRLPALRERADDIPLLLDYFLAKAGPRGHVPKSIHPLALEALQRHHWPGNVRELENAVQRAMVIAKGDVIRAEDLPAEIGKPAQSVPVAHDDIGSLSNKLFEWARGSKSFRVIAAVERELIANALRETDGNQVQAAKLLGITRATLRKRIEKYGIKRETSIQ